MWKVEVAQEYEADGGYTCRDTAVLAVEDLKSAEDVISVFEKYDGGQWDLVVSLFEKYGVGVIGYSITRKGEETNE